MSDQFVGEIRAVGFNFAPSGWALCQGQLMPISQNTALFSLLGTFYGGDGKSTFALPDLRGNVAIGFGPGPGLTERFIGETGGSETVTLIGAELPAHNHLVRASSDPASSLAAVGHYPAVSARSTYGGGGSALAADAVASTGSGTPHNNMQPFGVINYIIALQGIFPPRS